MFVRVGHPKGSNFDDTFYIARPRAVGNRELESPRRMGDRAAACMVWYLSHVVKVSVQVRAINFDEGRVGATVGW
jgi:hypothetical protein